MFFAGHWSPPDAQPSCVASPAIRDEDQEGALRGKGTVKHLKRNTRSGQDVPAHDCKILIERSRTKVI